MSKKTHLHCRDSDLQVCAGEMRMESDDRSLVLRARGRIQTNHPASIELVFCFDHSELA